MGLQTLAAEMPPPRPPLPRGQTGQDLAELSLHWPGLVTSSALPGCLSHKRGAHSGSGPCALKPGLGRNPSVQQQRDR